MRTYIWPMETDINWKCAILINTHQVSCFISFFTAGSLTQPCPNYGHEQISWLCAKFITHLFAFSELPPSSSGSTVKLLYFIAYTLDRTKLHPQ